MEGSTSMFAWELGIMKLIKQEKWAATKLVTLGTCIVTLHYPPLWLWTYIVFGQQELHSHYYISLL